MASFSQLYVHCVWSTFNRLPLLTPEIEETVYATLCRICHRHRCVPIAVGGTADHVHALLRWDTAISVDRLLTELKTSSARALASHPHMPTVLTWQHGYGAFSLSYRAVPQVQDYVVRQKHHHAQGMLIDDLEYCPD